MIQIHLVFHTCSSGILLPLDYARAPLNSREDRHCLGHSEESKPPTCQASCLTECQRLGWADTTHQGLRSETFHLQLCLGKVLQPPWDSSFPIWKEKEIRASFQDPKEGLLTPWDPRSIVTTVLFILLPLVSGQTGRH